MEPPLVKIRKINIKAMTKKILGIIVIALLVVLAIKIYQSGDSTYDGKFSEIDPTGRYRVSLVAISDEPQDNALEITDMKKNESVMTVPQEMLINKIESIDKLIDRNTAIYIAGTAFQEGNLGPWTKDGLVLWGKLKREDATMYKYYRIDLLRKELKVTSSIY